MRYKSLTLKKGFTLVEALVGVFVFSLVALGLYQAYFRVGQLAQGSRARTAAALLANDQLELVRNLPYDQVGILNGLPAGALPRFQTLAGYGFNFQATTTIRNIDDPFDGTIGGSPNDLSPADYKVAAIEIGCETCPGFTPLIFTTTVAPRNLETASGNGALFIQVLNASGEAVPGAAVRIANPDATPPLLIDEVAANDGWFRLIDAPPGNFAYQVRVTKSGYSTSETLDPGALENPNPLNPHATVVAGQATALTLTIDELSQVTARTLNASCAPVGSVGFSLTGARLIGTDPDIVKYDEEFSTDGAGERLIEGLEWDTYTLGLTGVARHLAGSLPLLPLVVLPGAEQELTLVTVPAEPNGLLVTVKDASSGLPLDEAQVRLSGNGVDQEAFTSRGFFRQSDWVGAGQEIWLAPDRYWEDDGNIDGQIAPGELRLRSVFGSYLGNGTLTSSAFDLGTSTAVTLHTLNWLPESQPPTAGPEPVRFQAAVADEVTATTTWNFAGPDGTSASFYTLANRELHPALDGHRFLRLKLFLSTADPLVTPSLSDLAFTYGTACTPFGQVFFSDFADGVYEVSVEREGYVTWVNNAAVFNQDWQQLEVLLSPE
jgi:type II secretory pathway pseudopilin PulG